MKTSALPRRPMWRADALTHILKLLSPASAVILGGVFGPGLIDDWLARMHANQAVELATTNECTKAVSTLFQGQSPLELQRASIIMDKLHCDVAKRLPH